MIMNHVSSTPARKRSVRRRPLLSTAVSGMIFISSTYTLRYGSGLLWTTSCCSSLGVNAFLIMASSSNHQFRGGVHSNGGGRPESIIATRLPTALYCSATSLASTGAGAGEATSTSSDRVAANNDETISKLFDDFADFLIAKQRSIIEQLETMEQSSGKTFSLDAWGIFAQNDNDQENNDDFVASPRVVARTGSGGMTRVLQGGHVIEKGACSFTLIQNGRLTAERATTIRSRQQQSSDNDNNNNNTMPSIQAGDSYSAVALSMVLHTRSPLIPTFRSDVRIFMVRPSSTGSSSKNTIEEKNADTGVAWYGGGADLTPYYLFPDDISSFHILYRNLCNEHYPNHSEYSYAVMKKACDDYFYLPARSEHRGTGGIFFDDLPVDATSTAFVKDMTQTWMRSWLPIVERHRDTPYTEDQKYWQMIRRGRYLEFNLLYDRGVKFGLASTNPRVEGVMVSAPPMIAFEYNYHVTPCSPEDEIMQIVKKPRNWV